MAAPLLSLSSPPVSLSLTSHSSPLLKLFLSLHSRHGQLSSILKLPSPLQSDLIRQWETGGVLCYLLHFTIIRHSLKQDILFDLIGGACRAQNKTKQTGLVCWGMCGVCMPYTACGPAHFPVCHHTLPSGVGQLCSTHCLFARMSGIDVTPCYAWPGGGGVHFLEALFLGLFLSPLCVHPRRETDLNHPPSHLLLTTHTNYPPLTHAAPIPQPPCPAWRHSATFF